MKSIRIIAFDADDTIWADSKYFRQTEQRWAECLREYGDTESLHRRLFAIEQKNMDWYGYGTMAYTLSLVEAALEISRGEIKAEAIQQILETGRQMLAHPIELMEGAEEVLSVLSRQYSLMMITKGELLEQKRKLKKSGLQSYFQHIEIVTEKNSQNYAGILKKLHIEPEAFLMVGNSLKSDVLPVLEIGGNAVHIPTDQLWEYEHCSSLPSKPYTILSKLTELLTLIPLNP